MCSVYRFNSVSILLDCYIICTLAKSRDRAGSGTGSGTSFPFKTSEGRMPSALEAIPTGLRKELVIANFIWRCIDRACTERFETVGIKGNTTSLELYSRSVDNFSALQFFFPIFGQGNIIP